MDVISYALSKKIAEHAVSGVQSMSVNGQTLIINTKDSGVLTMTFPTPKDGVSVADIDVNANNQIVFTMSDGTEFISGKIPTVKGDAGFSPIITENADNTDKIYKLDITTADSTFTTPNLKGGASGSGEENKIDSISVNGVNVAPDENRNVDITVPTVTNDLTDELKSSYDDAVTEKHTHNNKTVLDDITAEKVESWNKAEENVQSDWNETDNTADGFIKNKPTIPDAYDDTALSGRVDNVETSIGDMSTIEVKSVSDLVSAINVLYNAFMSSINYANKKLTITYRNGGTVDIDMSAIITDTNIGELSNIDDTGIANKQVLSYDTATNKYIPTTIDTAGVLADAKKYTDDEIAKINNADAISVDEKPTYSNGTITYKKDGVEKTITDGDFWFFYTVDDMAYQTIWIDGVEFTTSVDGSVDFKDFVSKTNDLTSTYTGEETDKTKVTTIASLDALYAIISTALGKKVNTADIVDNLSSDATDKPLSAAQGKALDTKISNFVTTVEEDYAKTTDIPTILPANGGNSDTVNNHTVETDVPVDAVFTDTIYDDTEVKGSIDELNSNLDTLEFGEVAGGKNLFKYNEVSGTLSKTVECSLDAGTYTISALVNSSDTDSSTSLIQFYYEDGNSESYLLGRESRTSYTVTLTKHVIALIFYASKDWANSANDTFTYSDIQIEEGSTATEYEPYIPSVKMLAEEVSVQKNELDTLEYSDVAGGKNLLDPNYFTSQIVKVGGIGNVNGVSWDCDKVNWYIEDLSGISFKENTVYTIVLYGKCKNNEQSLTNLCIEYTDGTNSIIMFSSKNTNSLALRVTDSNKTISKLAFYYGSRGTDLNPKKCGIFEGTIKESDFEPYIPSVKMLAEENAQQSNEIMDIKMLGWTVPRECPIQNYVDSDGVFHQRVGRVDLGSLSWIKRNDASFSVEKFLKDVPMENKTFGTFCHLYSNSDWAAVTSNAADKCITLFSYNTWGYASIAIRDRSYTDADTFKNAMQGVYLYYELATEITMTIDGNEAVIKLNKSLAYNASKNMLSAIVGTISGVTITSKDKSTALLNGTNTENVSVFTTADVIPSGSYHLKLSNKVGSMFVWDTTHSKTIIDVDNTECNFTLTEPSKLLVGFSVGSGHSFTNFEVSGQLEKGTVATDFVPYNGKSNFELTNDVISLKNDLETLKLSDVAGGKNILDINKVLEWINKYTNGTYSNDILTISPINNYLFTNPFQFSDVDIDVTLSVESFNFAGGSNARISLLNSNNISVGDIYTGMTSIRAKASRIRIDYSTLPTSITLDKLMLQLGATATPYEPYIPSVKMLAEKADNVNESLSDLEYLGWSVPDKCSLKNYKDKNEAFHQKVGRVFVDGNTSLSPYHIESTGTLAIYYPTLGISLEEKNNICCCATLESFTLSELENSKIGYYVNTNDDHIYINIKGGASSLDEFKANVNASPLVFYYKLDSEKIIIDGNEAVTKIKNDLIVLEATSTIDMTASRELDDITSSLLTIPSGYKPIAMYGYNEENNDNISAIPLLIRSDGKVLFHAKNHSTSDQGIIHFVIRVTFKKVS